VLERSTSVDVFQVFDLQNPTKIDEDTTILAIIIEHKFVKKPCSPKNCNNATTVRLIHIAGSALENSDHGDAIQVFHHPNLGDIG
jgi:hypothetical protein